MSLAGVLASSCEPRVAPPDEKEVDLRAAAEAVGLDHERLVVLTARSPPASGPGGGVLKLADPESRRIWRWGPEPPPTPRGGFCADEVIDRLPGGPQEEIWILIRHDVRDRMRWDPEEFQGLEPVEVRELLEERQNALAEQAADQHREILGVDREPDEFFGPFVAERVPRGLIPDLCDRADLLFVGPYRRPQVLDQGSPPQSIADSLPTTQTARVQQEGILGSGVRVAVLESGGLYFDRDCYKLKKIQDRYAGSDEHISKAMAMVGSFLPVDSRDCAARVAVGYGPGATLLMANAETTDDEDRTISDWLEAAKWAVKKHHSDVVTMSFHPRDEETDGRLGSRDVFFDYVAVTHRVTVLTSAGNQGALPVPAYASGKGYNILGVANVVNSEGADRCGKSIDRQSSWKNPETSHHDRELPEIAMPGSSYRIGGIPFGNTSAATPAAAGVASLLIEAEKDLRWEPQAVRALLLATADFQLSDRWVWDPSVTCDGYDGTGLVNAWQAYLAARSRGPGPSSHGHDHGVLRSEDFEPIDEESIALPARRFDRTWSIQAARGDTIRAVFTWNSDVFSKKGPSELGVDLDLVLTGPCKGCFAISAKLDSNYELVTFEASKAGTYELSVHGFDIHRRLHTGYGIAWMTKAEICAVGIDECGF